MAHVRQSLSRLFLNKPTADEALHLVLIGLGGGSLVKYCYEHFPHCQITAVEINANVIAMRDQFMIPHDDDRLRIIHADAIEWLPQQQCDADVIFLDAYDVNGLVPALNTKAFYASCHQQLNQDGVLIANVWGKPSVLAPMLAILHEQFMRHVCWLKSADSYNLIVFAIKDAIEFHGKAKLGNFSETLLIRHRTLQLQYLIENLQFLDLKEQQPISEIELLEGLQNQLRTLLVADPNVPQNYAEFKSLILNAIGDPQE